MSDRAQSGDGEASAATGVLMDPDDRLAFEKLLAGLRLTFLLSAPLPLVAFGAQALPFVGIIAGAAASTILLAAVLLWRAPRVLLRWQLGLRLLDCAIVYVVLTRYHAFMGNAYYDAVYLLFVVAAAATHGRRGALLIAVAAGLGVLVSRLQLVAAGTLAMEPRHLTDSLFFTLFFGSVGLAVAYLMEKGGQVAARRERVFRAEVEDLAARNARLYEEAREAVKAREALLALASHDVKNPLTSIRTYAQLLRREAQSGRPLDLERLADRLARIDAATRRVQQLADEMSDAARLEIGQELPLEPVETDLVALASQAVEDLLPQAAACDLVLEAEVPSLTGCWDRPRLERVLANLVSNALKYSPAGGQVRVVVGPDRDADEPGARVVVSDQGIGIPAEDLDRIFTRFERGRNVGRIAGSGLGLAGARAVVQQHGGQIEIASQEGRGTRVTVRLPLAPPDSPADQPECPSSLS